MRASRSLPRKKGQASQTGVKDNVTVQDIINDRILLLVLLVCVVIVSLLA